MLIHQFTSCVHYLVYTQGEVTSQNLYGLDTIAILWVKHGIVGGVKGRRVIALFK